MIPKYWAKCIWRVYNILGRFQCLSTLITGKSHNLVFWPHFCSILHLLVTPNPQINIGQKISQPTILDSDLKDIQYFRKVPVLQYPYKWIKKIIIWCFVPIFALFCTILDPSVTTNPKYCAKYGLATLLDLDPKVIQNFRKVPLPQYHCNWIKRHDLVFLAPFLLYFGPFLHQKPLITK